MRTMNFYDHFDELRARFVRCLIVFFLGFILCYGLAEPLLKVLRAPLFAVMAPDQRRLYFTSLFENFLTHLKVAGYASLFIFSPYYFYQLWAFVAPGLYEKEKRLVFPFVAAASLFFVGGACFAYFVLFPVGFKYFISYGVSTDIPLLTIDSYYTTCLRLLLLFGLAFELPVLLCLLGYLGVVDAPFLRKHRRMAIIGIAVVAALFAPPDAISMLVLGAPLVLFYEGAIWVIHGMSLKRKKPPETGEAEKPHPFEGRSR